MSREESRSEAVAKRGGRGGVASRLDRSWLSWTWYRLVRRVVLGVGWLFGGIRASGVENVPARGGVLLISNHLSHLDVFVLGVRLPRPLNYVARSTLFKPILGPFIRSMGGFPIEREGAGIQGVKETLKRLRAGSIVTFFPEGTRSVDGELAPLKPGIAVLASRAGVPIVAAGLAGTYEAWPRSRRFPRAHTMFVHYGRAIECSELVGLTSDEVLARLSEGLRESVGKAREGLEVDERKRRGDRRPN